jgi:F0F1-type ATP synthase epsilon subunit
MTNTIIVKLKHHIPLAAELVIDLRKLMKINGDDYLFSLDGGITPVTRRHIIMVLIRLLRISEFLMMRLWSVD